MGGHLRNGLEVSTALTTNAIYNKLQGDWIRGLAGVNRNGLDIVFIGISTGEVYKVSICLLFVVCCSFVVCLSIYHPHF